LADEDLNFSGVSAVAGNDAWAVGSSGIYHFNGTQWQQFDPNNALRALAMLNASDGWAVGVNGAIQHYNGAAWTAVTSPVTETLRAIDLLPDGSAGWAAGGRTQCTGAPPSETCTYTGRTVRFDGAQWQAVPFPFADDLEYINIISAGEAWAASGVQIYHYINGAWTQVGVARLALPNSTGGPGSFFRFSASGFEAGSTLDVCVNRTHIGQSTVDQFGLSSFGIQTAGGIAPGAYNVVAGPSACPTLAAAAEGAVTALKADQLFFVQAGAPVLNAPPGFGGEVLALSGDILPLAPALAVTHTAAPTSVTAPGGPVTFTVRVDNSGDGYLMLTELDDSRYGAIGLGANPQISSTTCLIPRGLPEGESYACDFVATVSGQPGTVQTNLLTVTATTAITTEIGDTGSTQVTVVGPAGPTDASLTITKTVVGPAPAANWSFIGPSGAFTLPASGGSRSFTGLAAGAYTLSETVSSDYSAAVVCSNGSSGANSVTVNLGAGASVGCTFTNTHTGDERDELFLPALHR
jgi:hypothetical protein